MKFSPPIFAFWQRFYIDFFFFNNQFNTFVWIIIDAVQLEKIYFVLFISRTICTSLGMFCNYAKHDKTLFGPHTIIVQDYSHSEAQNRVPLQIFIHKYMHISNNTRWTFTSNLGWWTGIFLWLLFQSHIFFLHCVNYDDMQWSQDPNHTF